MARASETAVCYGGDAAAWLAWLGAVLGTNGSSFCGLCLNLCAQLIEWSNTPSTPYALYSCNAYLTPTSNEGDVQAELRLKEILQQFLFMFFATEMLFAVCP